MVDAYFYSADSELLVVPQEGRLRFCTELGIIDLEPKEIAIIPRGLVYRVEVLEGPCRGFVCENYGQKFELPARGPIGANALANPRDFKAPVAAFEDREVPSTLTIKWCGQFHETKINQSPLDVVAWHGNYAPYKYDLRTYCPVGAILFDHPDPSIFTVLTAPSGVPGTANIDFVLFRERWMVAENTFRPPWSWCAYRSARSAPRPNAAPGSSGTGPAKPRPGRRWGRISNRAGRSWYSGANA
jgi:homogentisate 1,2-dioxygenase